MRAVDRESILPVLKAHRREFRAPDGTVAEAELHLVFHRKTARDINEAYTLGLSKSAPEAAVVQYIPRTDETAETVETAEAADVILTLNSPVLFTTNRFKRGGILNGTRGTVTGFSREWLPIVTLQTGARVLVPVVQAGETVHLPLVPAKAITVHKSQGMTLDCPVQIDLNGGKEFSPNLIYVAVSRVRTLDNVRFVNVPETPGDLWFCRQDPRVAEWCAAAKMHAAGEGRL
jgi:hypothetical protein